MIDGIPYWGSTTYTDMSRIQKKEVKLKRVSFDIIGGILHFGELNGVIPLTSEYCTYIRDICFNYRDQYIYLPYWEYVTTWVDTAEGHIQGVDEQDGKLGVKHSFIKRKWRLGKTIKNLEVYVPSEDTLYTWKVTEPREQEYKLSEIYRRYIGVAYKWDARGVSTYVNSTFYHKIGREQGNNPEYSLRRKCGLLTYGEGDLFETINYRDVRVYSEMYTQEYDTDYWRRKLEFEVYLYVAMQLADKGIVAEDADSMYHAFINGKIRKYKIEEKGGIPLYLKYYYIEKNKGVYKKKSYERYKV